ncbi:MAG: 30S ribosomal protein S12 methylthiotransferase RimO [Gemmatales bacterium]|nr:30S ribosomal protein S12 methylthiotransferase RimO [Gemmatales bacterium]MDW8387705.1 30S ribosomal protein S12 methylthiotransferase RimO [Gemmatales bacterium]
MNKATLAFVSLGCAKNLVDSERMLGLLAQDGFALTPEADGADVVVVNTCGFIEASRQESLGVIREMVDLKQRGRVRAVVVAGCLAERERERLLDEVPGVDHLVGVFGREEIVDVCNRLLDGRHEQQTLFRPASVRAMNDQARFRVTPRHYAYLKISEGCDRLCTFCSIPSMRGKHVSKPLEQIIGEARELIEDGVRELILVAQDTTYYGLDLYGQVRLAELLRELDQLDDLDWIRILYAYPMYFTDDLMQTLAEAEKILPYLDIPLQHINDKVLRRMQRRVNRQETETLLKQLRGTIANLVLRTTFIVGFPGETEEQFEELCEFVRDARFERVGVFTYSFEPNTPSARLDGHLPEEVKQERRNRLMEIQQANAFAWSAAQVGKELDVILDAPDAEAPGCYVGRSYADAPDIDGVVRIKGRKLRPGDLVRAKITGADGYDLFGRALEVR